MCANSVAVAIPTYSRVDLLTQLTDSIPQSIQVYVSDNNASMRPLSRDFPPNVHISHAEGLLPIFANWNRALSLIGDGSTHVLIPSDDDLYLPQAFETIERAMSAHPDVDVYVFGCDFADERGRTWPGYCPKQLELCAVGEGFFKFIAGVDARMPGLLFRREFLARIGHFDERFTLTAADSELIQRALLLGSCVFVPEVIGNYRVWTGSLTHARQASNHWMHEIDLWVDKIAQLLAGSHQPSAKSIDIGMFKDEIYIANLRAGIGALKAKGHHVGAWRHALAGRYPYRASPKSQAKLLAHLLLPHLK
jgi:hypothetical protein